MKESLAKKFCRCVKAVAKTYKKKDEGRAIAICTKSVLQTRKRTLKKFSCKKKMVLKTQALIAQH
jgi:hypothetical protein